MSGVPGFTEGVKGGVGGGEGREVGKVGEGGGCSANLLSLGRGGEGRRGGQERRLESAMEECQ